MINGEAKEELIGKAFPVLDDGHVMLVDCLGDDLSILAAARVSFGKGTRRLSGDRDLLRFLMRHEHATPFEMAEIVLRVRVPMDCWRQWIRHRTANVNEYSTRYSEAIDSAQTTRPDQWRSQSVTNKQGSGGFVTEWPADGSLSISPGAFESPGDFLSKAESSFQAHARHVYEDRLRLGVAREQARKDLPLSTYTEAYWKCDLRNVLHFLALRMHGHAQKEIRDYANVIGREIVAKLFPMTWEAFEDYTLGAVRLSRLDVEVIRKLVGSYRADETLKATFPNERERSECFSKLVALGFIEGATS